MPSIPFKPFRWLVRAPHRLSSWLQRATGILTLAPTLPLSKRVRPWRPAPICPRLDKPKPRMNSWEGRRERTGRTDLPIQQVKWLVAPLSYCSSSRGWLPLSLSMNDTEKGGSNFPTCILSPARSLEGRARWQMRSILKPDVKMYLV